MSVKQATEGVYYVELMLSSEDYQPNTMLYDIWGNIKYQGIKFDDIEMDFVTKSPNLFFDFGNSITENKKFIPIISGIKHDEKIMRGDKRKLIVTSKNEYSKNKATIYNQLEYRLYIKDGEREITVIDYQKVNQTINENYFILDTKMLVPQRYYIDVKYNYNLEEIYHNNVISFDIVSDLRKKYYS